MLERTPIVDRWLKYAHDDQASAERLMAAPPLVAGVVFHSQQAAEKSMKAYLYALQVAPVPRTHRLRDLAILASRAGGQIPPNEAVDFLDTYSIGIRYPDHELPLAEVARTAIRHAATIVSFVRKQLEIEND